MKTFDDRLFDAQRRLNAAVERDIKECISAGMSLADLRLVSFAGAPHAQELQWKGITINKYQIKFVVTDTDE